MSFEYREHVGESWIVAEAANLDESFQEGAKALFNLMVPLEQIKQIADQKVHCEAESLDMLFFEWLNQLILIKDVDGMIFSNFEVGIHKTDDLKYILNATAMGEFFDSSKHEGQVDVKAATYSELECVKTSEGYRVGCVLDI